MTMKTSIQQTLLKAALERLLAYASIPPEAANVKTVGTSLAVSTSIKIDGAWYIVLLSKQG